MQAREVVARKAILVMKRKVHLIIVQSSTPVISGQFDLEMH